MDFTEGLITKPGFAKMGGNAYFNAKGKVTHIYRLGKTWYPKHKGVGAYVKHDISKSACKKIKGKCKKCKFKFWKCCSCTVKGKVGWQHAKMAILGTTNAVITAIDHLYSLHLVASNAIITANVEALHHTHPIRQLLTPFGFRTATINWQASTALVNEFGLVHRAMPFTDKGLRQLYTYARTASAGIMFTPIPKMHAASGTGDLKLPLHEDGGDFYRVIYKYVQKYLSLYYDVKRDTCKTDKQMIKWHAEVNKILPNHDLPPLNCKNLQDILSTFIYLVTGGHNHVGTITAEIEDPCHMPWAWKEGFLCGTPRTTYTQLVTMQTTSLEQPKLMDDYQHVFKDKKAKAAWRNFHKDLKAFGKRVDQRNEKRERKFKSFDMRYVEVSIGI